VAVAAGITAVGIVGDGPNSTAIVVDIVDHPCLEVMPVLVVLC
jgi:hypothetical protein